MNEPEKAQVYPVKDLDKDATKVVIVTKRPRWCWNVDGFMLKAPVFQAAVDNVFIGINLCSL